MLQFFLVLPQVGFVRSGTKDDNSSLRSEYHVINVLFAFGLLKLHKQIFDQILS